MWYHIKRNGNKLYINEHEHINTTQSYDLFLKHLGYKYKRVKPNFQ